MVFRIPISGRGMVAFFLLILVASTITAPMTQAKPPNCIRQDEGDPGDGVLQPAATSSVELIPDPRAVNRPLFIVNLVPMPDGRFLPVFQLWDWDGSSGFQLENRVNEEGRWHHAP